MTSESPRIGLWQGNHLEDSTSVDLQNILKAMGIDVEVMRKKQQKGTDVFPNFDAIIAAGGDGTVRRVLQYLYTLNIVLPLYIFPGGTQNALYRSLINTGAKIDKEQIVDSTVDSEGLQVLHPGVIGDNIFATDINIGSIGYPIASMNKTMREKVPHLPGRIPLSALGAYAQLFFRQMSGDDIRPIIDIITSTPSYGKHTVFPNQRIFDDGLTRAKMEVQSGSEDMAKALLALGALGFGMTRLAHTVMRVEQQSEFVVDRSITGYMNSGSPVNKSLDEGMVVKRSAKGVPIAALV